MNFSVVFMVQKRVINESLAFQYLYFPFSLDPADVELCNAIANIVAVVLACPPKSNHLWYHFFAADQLFGTFMTGFMV